MMQAEAASASLAPLARASVVLYCAHGHEISLGLTATLLAMGVDARALEGGMSGWQAQGLAVQPVPCAMPAPGGGQ